MAVTRGNLADMLYRGTRTDVGDVLLDVAWSRARTNAGLAPDETPFSPYDPSVTIALLVMWESEANQLVDIASNMAETCHQRSEGIRAHLAETSRHGS